MKEQIAIHYRWQPVIYRGERNRLKLDINRGCWLSVGGGGDGGGGLLRRTRCLRASAEPLGL